MQIRNFFRKHGARLWEGHKTEDQSLRVIEWIVDFLGPTFPMADFDATTCARIEEAWGKLSTDGFNRKRAVVRKFLKRAVELGELDEMPSWPMRKRLIKGGQTECVRVRIFSEEEEFEFISRMTEPYASFFIFLIETGLRPDEALNLRWEDVDQRTLTVTRSKTGRQRVVPITHRCNKALTKADQTQVRVWGDDPDLAYWRINREFNRVKSELCMDDDDQLVLYCTRHTYATRLVQRGCPVLTVSHLLGHQSLETTQRYAHHTPTDAELARKFMEGDHLKDLR